MILETYSVKEHTVLEKKNRDTEKIEQEWMLTDKPTHMWTPYLWHRKQVYAMGKESLFNK